MVNPDFVESAVTDCVKKVQKKENKTKQKNHKKKKRKNVKWFSKYFLTLFFKMCMKKKIKFKKDFYMSENRELKNLKKMLLGRERDLSMFLVPFLSWLYGQ